MMRRRENARWERACFESSRARTRALRDAVAETLKMVDDDTRAWCDDDTVERFFFARIRGFEKGEEAIDEDAGVATRKEAGEVAVHGVL